MSAIKLDFGKPDKYDEIHAYVDLDYIQESLPMSTGKLQFEINDKIYDFTFEYSDAGTMAYARMEGQQAIGGMMMNITHDWSKTPTKEDYPKIHFVGSIDHNKKTMELQFFMSWK